MMHENSMRGPFPAIIFCLILVIGSVLTISAKAAEWVVVPDKSAIHWAAKWNTSPVHGGFEQFAADIIFDPDHPDKAAIAVDVDTGSIYMDGQDVRSTLTNETWFFTGAYPVARFVSQGVRHMGNGRYEAHGSLQIRGETQEVVLPFKLTIEGNIARVEGSLSLDRTVYGLGLVGDIAAGVAPKVDVSINVTARRQE